MKGDTSVAARHGGAATSAAVDVGNPAGATTNPPPRLITFLSERPLQAGYWKDGGNKCRQSEEARQVVGVAGSALESTRSRFK